MAMQLLDAGITSFTIYEKSDGVGGTWRDNSYPGACCDVPSHMYSFSFAPNKDWSRAYSEQPEILAYFERCADKPGLRERLRLNTEIRSMHFDEGTARWELGSATGEVFGADVVVSALGQLNRPSVPEFEGLDEFGGTMFHSARWDHSHDLTGRNVAVVGNAASALQFIPRIAGTAAHVDVFQRSPNWVIPKPNRRYDELTRWAFHSVPGLSNLERWRIYWSFEARWPVFAGPRWVGRALEQVARRYLASQVRDRELRAALTPDYPIGCKRILASDDYYAALCRDDVELVTTPIRRFTPEGIETLDGEVHAADTVIFATGFDSTHFLAPLDVTGRDGVSLEEVWRDGAEAYLGMMVTGFPNLFMLYGPNTNLGHNSILFMIECQVAWILQCVEELSHRDEPLEVSARAMAAHNDALQEAMGRTVWQGEYRSWYRHESGRITNNWPFSTLRYWFDTLGPDFDVLAGDHSPRIESVEREHAGLS